MTKTAVAITLIALATGASADAFPDADQPHGKTLHAEHCVACHERSYGGEEASAIYLRPDRKVQSIGGLKSQITTCTTMLGLDLFPEDEADIGAYLNDRFYRFEAP